MLLALSSLAAPHHWKLMRRHSLLLDSSPPNPLLPAASLLAFDPPRKQCTMILSGADSGSDSGDANHTIELDSNSANQGW